MCTFSRSERYELGIDAVSWPSACHLGDTPANLWGGCAKEGLSSGGLMAFRRRRSDHRKGSVQPAQRFPPGIRSAVLPVAVTRTVMTEVATHVRDILSRITKWWEAGEGFGL